MVTAVVESPLRQRQRQRLRSPLAGVGAGVGSSGGDGGLELRHACPAKRGSGSGGMRGRRWVPPEIEIPDVLLPGGGGGRGYTSLRDIMSSPEYAAAKAGSSPDEPPGGGGAAAAGDVHMIRHPLVKHAAYAYLQLTPSAREEARRRMLQRRRGPLCRVLFGCLGFLGALFGR
ncbi:hypothetical protein Zm00014a_044357 [Zea mays]|uniref:Uncharacterized protein n=1 Tax=Zea mays TaxID=4577 RepID=A0A3L6EX66_MAIZE|nr:hypothetical protein Zm00014a_044357 [Zea mays]